MKRIIPFFAIVTVFNFTGTNGLCDTVTESVRTYGLGSLSGAVTVPGNVQIVTYGSQGAFLWDVQSASIIREFKSGSNPVLTAAVSNDGTWLLTGHSDFTITLWDLATGGVLHTYRGHTDSISSLVFSPRGNQFVSSSYDKSVRLWDITSGVTVRTFDGHTAKVTSAALGPDNSGQPLILVTGGLERNVLVWNADTGELLHTIVSNFDYVRAVSVSSHDRRILVAGLLESKFDQYSGQDYSFLLSISNGTSYLTSVSYSPSGTKIVSTGDIATKVWDAMTGQMLRNLGGHGGGLYRAVYSSDEQYILTSGMDQLVKLWGMEDNEAYQKFQGHSLGVYDVAFSPSGDRMLTGDWDTTAKLWQLSDGQLIRRYKGTDSESIHIDVISAVGISPDGTNVMTCSLDATIKLWGIESGDYIRTFHYPADRVYYYYDAIYGNFGSGIMIYAASEDRTIHQWNPLSEDIVKRFSGHTGSVRCVAVLPGTLEEAPMLLSGSADKKAILWNANSGEMIRTFDGHTNTVYGVGFASDRTHIITTSADRTAKIWNFRTGELVMTLSGHTGSVESGKFSSDGSLILTSSLDGTAKLWKRTTGELLRTLNVYSNGVNNAVFTPSGTGVVTAAQDGTAKLWDVSDLTGSSGGDATPTPTATIPVVAPTATPTQVAFTPNYVFDFNENSLSDAGFLDVPGGFEQVPEQGTLIVANILPTDNAFTGATDGRGIVISVDASERYAILGLPIDVQGKSVLMRASVRSNGGYAIVQIGALSSQGQTLNNSLSLQQSGNSQSFTNVWKRFGTWLDPPAPNTHIWPLFQVVNVEGGASTTIYLDRLELYILEPGQSMPSEFFGADGTSP